MRFNGTLSSWNEERGFGFIAAIGGDREVFAHASAFPRDGRKPRVGEKVTFEIELDAAGRKRAVNVRRQEVSRPSRAQLAQSTPAVRERNRLARMPAVLTLAAIGAFGYSVYSRRIDATPPVTAVSPATARATAPVEREARGTTAFHCDGRVHCSQMKSCAEAKYFLANCPGTKMDGDNDGVPCEQQWCTGVFGR